jgi:hypothetical protein
VFTLLPGSLSDDEMQLRIAIGRLNSRILNSQLRQKVTDFTAHCVTELLVFAQFRQDNDAARAISALNQHYSETLELYQALVDSIGERIRAELDRRYLADGDTH